MFAHSAEVGGAGGEDAPVFAPAFVDDPAGEFGVGVEADEVGGAFFDVGFEFAGVEADVFGLALVEFVEQVGDGGAVEDVLISSKSCCDP